ncbi:MAG: hypothetical protein RI957_1091 [Verrucomicrobiota bacterium]|jgi:hypothetical protein
MLLGMWGVGWAAESLPEVKDLILPNMQELAEVEMITVPSGITMAISSSDAKAQKHVIQGLNLIHGGWDFEAYRHFIAALRMDPDCIMAHFGVVFSLLDTESEFMKPRMAAADRALALVQAEKGTELERGYIYAMTRLLDEGPAAAANAFAEVSRKFPGDWQLKLFEVYFRRSGFDEYGSPKPDQKVAQEKLSALMKAQPDSALLQHAWLMMRAENLTMAEDLPMARRLSLVVPDYPPYLHLLGHYEWRCGNHREAVAAFSRCGDLYLQWMKRSGMTMADCPEWIRAEVYRAIALTSAGEEEAALTVARSLVKTPLPSERWKSAGSRMMWWEANTLEARLLMRRGGKGDLEKAKTSLPSKVAVKSMTPHSKVAFFYQGLAMILDAQIALSQKDTRRLEEIQQALTMHMPLMEQVRRDAVMLGELAPFARAQSFLEIATLKLKGDVAMNKSGADAGVAYNWYSGARERQVLASRMMPPAFLLPMNVPLGRHFESKKQFDRAKEMYLEGLQYWPRDLCLLDALQQLQILTKDVAGAKATADLIQSIQRKK